jgi:hypothetical protein
LLHEVGVIKRPLLGRISIRATFADDQSAEVREGDVRSAIAEAGSMTGYLVGSVAPNREPGFPAARRTGRPHHRGRPARPAHAGRPTHPSTTTDRG